MSDTPQLGYYKSGKPVETPGQLLWLIRIAEGETARCRQRGDTNVPWVWFNAAIGTLVLVLGVVEHGAPLVLLSSLGWYFPALLWYAMARRWWREAHALEEILPGLRRVHQQRCALVQTGINAHLIDPDSSGALFTIQPIPDKAYAHYSLPSGVAVRNLRRRSVRRARSSQSG